MTATVKSDVKMDHSCNWRCCFGCKDPESCTPDRKLSVASQNYVEAGYPLSPSDQKTMEVAQAVLDKK